MANTDAVTSIAEIAAHRLFGPAWADRLSIGVGLILLSTLSAYLLTGPRVTFAMARAGQFPAIAGRLSARTGTPVVATILQAGWGLVLLWTGSFEAIVLYAGVGLSLASLLSVGAVYVLRVRQPDLASTVPGAGLPLGPGDLPARQRRPDRRRLQRGALDLGLLRPQHPLRPARLCDHGLEASKENGLIGHGNRWIFGRFP